MQTTSMESVPGETVAESLGLVRGNTVRSRNAFSDFTQGLQNIVGGELSAYSSLLSESRDQALERMEAEAAELGADAVVNVRFATSGITKSSAEILAYGTAVELEH